MMQFYNTHRSPQQMLSNGVQICQNHQDKHSCYCMHVYIWWPLELSYCLQRWYGTGSGLHKVRATPPYPLPPPQ